MPSPFRPGESDDDAYDNGTAIQRATNPLIMGDILGTQYQTGVRFKSLDIPPGSTINTAKVTFQAQLDRTTNTCNIQIKGQDDDNPNTFSTHADFIARARTTQYVNWDDVPDWITNNDYDTPSLTDIIQAIINRPLWASGNSLVLFFANNASSNNAERRGKSYDLSTTLCPNLIITWTPPSGPNNLKTISPINSYVQDKHSRKKRKNISL